MCRVSGQRCRRDPVSARPVPGVRGVPPGALGASRCAAAVVCCTAGLTTAAVVRRSSSRISNTRRQRSATRQRCAHSPHSLCWLSLTMPARARNHRTCLWRPTGRSTSRSCLRASPRSVLPLFLRKHACRLSCAVALCAERQRPACAYERQPQPRRRRQQRCGHAGELAASAPLWSLASGCADTVGRCCLRRCKCTCR